MPERFERARAGETETKKASHYLMPQLFQSMDTRLLLLLVLLSHPYLKGSVVWLTTDTGMTQGGAKPTMLEATQDRCWHHVEVLRYLLVEPRGVNRSLEVLAALSLYPMLLLRGVFSCTSCADEGEKSCLETMCVRVNVGSKSN